MNVLYLSHPIAGYLVVEGKTILCRRERIFTVNIYVTSKVIKFIGTPIPAITVCGQFSRAIQTVEAVASGKQITD